MDIRIRLGLLTAGLVLAVAPGLAAQEAALPADVTPAMIEQGKKIFHGKGLCVACHGQAARGGLAPSLADTAWIHSRGTYEEIIAQIQRGVPAESSQSRTPMPPGGGGGLKPEEIRAVAAYVRSLRGQVAAMGPTVDCPEAN